MKVEVKEAAQERKYPYLGRFRNGAIVLFIDKKTGVCLVDGELNPLGEFSDAWAEREFDVFIGSVTLSNGSDES